MGAKKKASGIVAGSKPPSIRVPENYATLLAELKGRVRSAQAKAATSVNRELIALYLHIVECRENGVVVAHHEGCHGLAASLDGPGIAFDSVVARGSQLDLARIVRRNLRRSSQDVEAPAQPPPAQPMRGERPRFPGERGRRGGRVDMQIQQGLHVPTVVNEHAGDDVDPRPGRCSTAARRESEKHGSQATREHVERAARDKPPRTGGFQASIAPIGGNNVVRRAAGGRRRGEKYESGVEYATDALTVPRP